MNRAQEQALREARPDGHAASEGRASPLHRVAECDCGWRQQFPRRGRNGLATTSAIHGAILAHYRAHAVTHCHRCGERAFHEAKGYCAACGYELCGAAQ